MMQNYLDIVSKTKDMKEKDKDFYRAIALIRELGYDLCDPSSVKLGVESPHGRADFILENDYLVINFIMGNKRFVIDSDGAPKLDEDGRVIVYLSAKDYRAHIYCEYFKMDKLIVLNNSINELVFMYNTYKGKEEFNEIKAHRNDDLNELNALLMCIYTGKISQGFMDLLGVSDSKAFADNFYDALGKMKAEGFKQPVQLVVAKELGGTKLWRRTRLSF